MSLTNENSRGTGSIVAELARLVARSGPLLVDEVEYADPVAGVRGESWGATLVCPWRLWRDEELLVEPDALDGDPTVNEELVADALWELIGHYLIEVRNSPKNMNDPIFCFTGGYVLDVEADTDIDPWTFSVPGMTFVGTRTAM